MKIFNRVLIILLAFVSVLGLVSPAVTLAVTPPDRTFGITATYSVYGSAGVTNTGGGTSPTRVWGNVGENGFGDNSLTAVQVPSGIINDTGPTGTLIENDARSVYDSLMSGTQGTPPAGIFDLAGTHTVAGGNPITPGVYNVGATTMDGAVELSGAGVYIFRSDSSATISTSGTARMTLLNGATACNVFWAIPASMTIGTGAHIEGTIIASTGAITIETGATLVGRAISLTKAVTLDANQITRPTCVAPVVYSSTPRTGTINVVKHVINDNGGTKTVAGFPLFVSGVSVVSGVTNTFHAPAGVYAVTETSDSHYTQSFSGDCDVNGNLNLNPGDNKICIITNNDIGAPIITPPVPPLIDVVKVPSPLSLPNGPGLVNYTYTLRNIGTVSVSNVTMVGDTCSPITLVSGDLNSDSKLNVNETWVYKCSTILQETHTNTVVATGWANGIAATDIASANVVVGIPIVPPLIHITKVPNPFTLPAGGGMVTYTKTVTNPGTEPLSNVKVTDDKCGPITYISGDTNNDTKLDPNETWTYTCKTNLTATTLNTAFATGEANGLVARDFALATVVVAAPAPALPATGVHNSSWSLIALSCLFISISASLFVAYKKSKI